MNTIYKFPASKLPSELRGDISDDALVTISIKDENELIWDYSANETKFLISKTMPQMMKCGGIVCTSESHIDEFFDGIKAKIDTEYSAA